MNKKTIIPKNEKVTPARKADLKAAVRKSERLVMPRLAGNHNQVFL